MDLQDLIQTVVQEVVNRLDNEPEIACVAVLGERDDAVCVRVCEGIGTECAVLFDGEKLNGRKPSHYVLPHLSCSDMADLAMGKATSDCAAKVLKLLLSGSDVHVLDFGYRAYEATAPGPLLDLYEEYEKRLASFGLKEWKPKSAGIVRFRGSLLTEQQVIDLCSDGVTTLQVPAKAVITPLALETARNFNCFIEKQG